MPEIEKLLGTDEPWQRAVGKRYRSVVERLWADLKSPSKAHDKGVMLIFRIVDRANPDKAVAHQVYYTSADSLVSAARTGMTGHFISLKKLFERVEGVNVDSTQDVIQPIND